jgi:lysophospholipase L1-like esterase
VPVTQVQGGLTSAQLAAGAVAPAAVSSTGSILGADGAPVSGASPKLTALASAIRGARVRNYQVAPPLVAQKAWAATTAYSLNEVIVNGSDCWLVYTPGTTGSTAPVIPANPSDGVTDGTCVLRYAGPARVVAAANDDTPTLSEVRWDSGIAGMTAYNAQTSLAPFTITNMRAGGAVNHYSGVAFPATWTNGTSWFGDTTVPALVGRAPTATRRIGFVTYSKRVFIPCNTNGQVSAEINGVPLVQGCYTVKGGSNVYGLMITFPSRRRREIWFLNNYSADFVGVYVDSADQISPISKGSVTLTVEGDSTTAGGNGTPYWWRADWPSQLADYVGIVDVWNMAQGGTGIINAGSGVPMSNATRLQYVLDTKPDIFILAGGHNDVSLASNVRVPGFTSYLQSVRAGLPDAYILVFGTTLLRAEGTANQSLVDADLSAVVTALRAAGDTKIWFLPTITDPGGTWLPAASVAPYFSTSGDGHTAQPGIDYLASRYTAAFENWLYSVVK